MTPRLTRPLAVAAVISFVVASCGDDDGGGVRDGTVVEIEDDSDSGSSSGSGSGSGSGSEPASGSGSGSEPSDD